MNINNNKIKQNKLETEYNYSLRKLFIAFYDPKTDKELNESEMYSNIWINIIVLGCKYNIEIEKRMDKMIKKDKMLILEKKILNKI